MIQHICVTLVPLFNYLSEDEQIKINRLAQHKKIKKNAQKKRKSGVDPL